LDVCGRPLLTNLVTILYSYIEISYTIKFSSQNNLTPNIAQGPCTKDYGIEALAANVPFWICPCAL